jgi:hypothetical protein
VGSVSSAPWLTSIERFVENDPTIPPEAVTLARAVEGLLVDPEARPNPHIGWLDVRKNGYAVVTAAEENLEVSAFTLHDSFVRKPPSELSGSFESHFEHFEFRVPAGSRNLEHHVDGSWHRWDMATMRWV